MTELKVCGIRSAREIEELRDQPVSYFGMIFADSKRQVTLETAREICAAIEKAGKKKVAVFVNASNADILKVCLLLRVDVVQLHGQESPHQCEQLKKELKKNALSKVKIWKSFSVANTLPSDEIREQYRDSIELFLFDTRGKFAGGNGQSFDWSLLRTWPPFSFVLAGGIDAANFTRAFQYKPAVIDINSKIENVFNTEKNLSREASSSFSVTQKPVEKQTRKDRKKLQAISEQFLLLKQKALGQQKTKAEKYKTD